MFNAPASRLKTKVSPAELPGLQGLTTLAAGVVTIAALYFAREVLVPITLAVLLSFVLAPLVTLLRRTKLGRVPSVLAAVVLALGVILGLGAVIGVQVAQLAGDAPRYASTIEHKVDVVRGYTVGRLTEFTGQLGRQMAPAAPPALAAATDQPEPVPVEVRQPDPNPLAVAERLLAPVLSTVWAFQTKRGFTVRV